MNITEDQKKLIESTGHYVIEFKKWVKDLAIVVNDFINTLYAWVSRLVSRLLPIIDDIADMIFETAPKIENTLKKFQTVRTNRYIPVMKIGKAKEYKPLFHVYHIRSNI